MLRCRLERLLLMVAPDLTASHKNPHETVPKRLTFRHISNSYTAIRNYLCQIPALSPSIKTRTPYPMQPHTPTATSQESFKCVAIYHAFVQTRIIASSWVSVPVNHQPCLLHRPPASYLPSHTDRGPHSYIIVAPARTARLAAVSAQRVDYLLV